MKFGKTIQRAQSVSEPSWYPFWLDYKQLKKVLNAMELPAPKNEDDSGSAKTCTTDKAALAACSKAFFRLLHNELAKLSRFFSEREEQLTSSANAFRDAVEPRLDNAGGTISSNPLSAEEVQQHISTVVGHYKQLMMLENFAILNYVGFSKILKKHDKMTHHITCAKFMQNAVQKHPFSRYTRLEKALQATESLFVRLRAIAPVEGPGNAPCLPSVPSCALTSAHAVPVHTAVTGAAPTQGHSGLVLPSQASPSLSQASMSPPRASTPPLQAPQPPPQASEASASSGRPRLCTADEATLQAIGAMREMAAAASASDARGIRGVREALSRSAVATQTAHPEAAGARRTKRSHEAMTGQDHGQCQNEAADDSGSDNTTKTRKISSTTNTAN